MRGYPLGLIALTLAAVPVTGSPMPTTVLIVDDDRNVGRSVSMVLGKRGMEARSAAPLDWSSALTEDVDVVLLDLYLGSIKGRDVLERLLAEQPLMSVVIMSGVATAQEAVDCVRCGAFDYLDAGEVSAHRLDRRRHGRRAHRRRHQRRPRTGG